MQNSHLIGHAMVNLFFPPELAVCCTQIKYNNFVSSGQVGLSLPPKDKVCFYVFTVTITERNVTINDVVCCVRNAFS